MYLRLLILGVGLIVGVGLLRQDGEAAARDQNLWGQFGQNI